VTDLNPPAVLWIDRNESRCGVCGKPTRWGTETHVTNLGWNREINGTPGCGVRWTHVCSNYALSPDDDMGRSVRAMRPDLVWYDRSEMSRG
jgi:hypothetical protein